MKNLLCGIGKRFLCSLGRKIKLGEIRMDLLKVYGECWGGEAGEWNTSLENKYLEYMFAKFFEGNFSVEKTGTILNIGIGAGYWDRYLSYKVPEGQLTSIDIDKEICDNMVACLKNENNTNPITIICDDALKHDFNQQYDIVTLVGSAASETGAVADVIIRAIELLNDKGSLFLQVLHKEEGFDIKAFCEKNNAIVDKMLVDESYEIHAEYYKITKAH